MVIQQSTFVHVELLSSNTSIVPVVATIMEVLQQVFEGWQVDEQTIQFLLHGHAFVAHLVLQEHQVVMGVSSSRILNSKQLFLAL